MGTAWVPWTAEDKEARKSTTSSSEDVISTERLIIRRNMQKDRTLDSMERRREDADMIQTYKIIAGEDRVERAT